MVFVTFKFGQPNRFSNFCSPRFKVMLIRRFNRDNAQRLMTTSMTTQILYYFQKATFRSTRGQDFSVSHAMISVRKRKNFSQLMKLEFLQFVNASCCMRHKQRLLKY